MNREELLQIIDQAARSGQTTLDLSGKRLRTLPVEIGRLTNLTALYLHNNQLTVLPPEVANLTRLSVLGLGGNQFEQLSREVVALPNLVELYLDNNRLTEIPSEIGQLNKLEELFLDGNRLTAVPPEIGQLTGLRKLDLARNQLSSLPSAIHTMSNLRKLGLGGNRLAQLPQEIGQLKSLEELYLDSNQLKTLPPEVLQLRNLLALSLGPNPLNELPLELEKLDWLQRLDLAGMGLGALPIAVVHLANLTDLCLDMNRLTTFPEEIGQLTKLKTLNAGRNQLTKIPPEIGRLTNLQKLGLAFNELHELPPEIGNLRNLSDLDLAANHLEDVPSEIGQLIELRKLGLGRNQLTKIPPEIGRLAKLEELYLDNNFIGALPPGIGGLTKLGILGLGNNRLTRIPENLGQLTALTALHVDNNPLLDDPLKQRLAERGLGELLAYLRTLDEASEPLYEAKLVFVGEGGVGKTALLGALLGEAFVENRPTTHGVEVERKTLQLGHPDHPDTKIKLNAWDFGGQKVYRITHQFFFSRGALYLLPWNPRLGVEPCDVEGWIQRIKLRVGGEARVIIVATHCQTADHPANIDETRLRRDHGDLDLVFHSVDSKTGYGIEDLKARIARTAAKLPLMGEKFIPRWKRACDEVLALADSRVPLDRFADICSWFGLTREEAKRLAVLMATLGWVVYYADDEGLRDDLVLHPQWLAKAIGFVLEDPETNRRQGLLEHKRLRQIWCDHDTAGRERYEPAMHPFFLRLMEKFDISYRLEGEPDCSLVAQLVPEVRPALPWDPDERPAPSDDRAGLRLVCKMKQSPPGLVPWMTVRTHRFATDKFWQRGVFLKHPPHGEAVLELRETKLNVEFTITVRATFPTHFLSVLQDMVMHLIEQRWPGLEYELAIPCPGRKKDGRACEGRFYLDALHDFKREGDVRIRCQECRQWQVIDMLLFGFEPPSVDLKARLDELERLIHTTQAAASYAAHMARILLKAVSKETPCPHLFTLLPEDLDMIDRLILGKTGMRFTLWCEYPNGQHPVCVIGSGGKLPSGDRVGGEWVITQPREWLVKIAPYAKMVATVLGAALGTAVPIAGPIAKVAIDWMQTLKEKLDSAGRQLDELESGVLVHDKLDKPYGLHQMDEGSGLRQLYTLLLELDPNKEWGGLCRVVSGTGDYLWVCPTHYPIYDPGLPVLPKQGREVGRVGAP